MSGIALSCVTGCFCADLCATDHPRFTKASDVYSTTCVVVECLLQQLPWEHMDRMVNIQAATKASLQPQS